MTTIRYHIEELIPYINWIYFFHAWGVREAQAPELKKEAEELLQQWSRDEEKSTIFRAVLFKANSSEDDIILYADGKQGNNPTVSTTLPGSNLVRLPMLRQQRPPYLCLADFLPPSGMEPQTMGLFASTVPFEVHGLMEQTLSDRLAEATAERGHEEIRKRIWGYSPKENLTPQELFAEHYQGKRPAVGYPSLPDQSINFIIGKLLDFQSIGISLTENGAMLPHASTSGLMLSHPQCRHFSIGVIGEDQLYDYAGRRGIDAELLRRFLEIQ